jgi:hypothetical protein
MNVEIRRANVIVLSSTHYAGGPSCSALPTFDNGDFEI